MNTFADWRADCRNITGMDDIREFYTGEEKRLLSECTLCPRECRVDRFEGGSGYCGADAGMNIASVCIHKGEEPAISGRDGICNIFFSGCNLRCIYCQNHEISRPGSDQGSGRIHGFAAIMKTITDHLDSGIRAVGFVSPSHVLPQVKAIIRALRSLGYSPVTVYNTNGYDKRETIRSLDGLIDVWLPDYKYVSPSLAGTLSGAPDYPQIVLEALKEMYYQKGSVLSTDSEGRAGNGLLIRHLVLPGHAPESCEVLRSIAAELSTGVTISLMSQYHPTPLVKPDPELGRTLYASEYELVVKTMELLGFRNGWTQDLDSYRNYQPDFSRDHPFE